MKILSSDGVSGDVCGSSLAISDRYYDRRRSGPPLYGADDPADPRQRFYLRQRRIHPVTALVTISIVRGQRALYTAPHHAYLHPRQIRTCGLASLLGGDELHLRPT